MKRRDLFRSIAALTAVAALAPAVKAEATPIFDPGGVGARFRSMSDDEITAYLVDTDGLDRLRDATYHAEMGEVWQDGAWHNVEDIKADAYNRGLAIAEARAESRQRLGLPLERGAYVVAWGDEVAGSIVPPDDREAWIAHLNRQLT